MCFGLKELTRNGHWLYLFARMLALKFKIAKLLDCNPGPKSAMACSLVLSVEYGSGRFPSKDLLSKDQWLSPDEKVI